MGLTTWDTPPLPHLGNLHPFPTLDTPTHSPLSASAQDFHIVKMPLLEEEVRGPEALQAFSHNLIRPYQGPSSSAGGAADNSLVGELQRQVQQLQARVRELEAQLTAAKA